MSDIVCDVANGFFAPNTRKWRMPKSSPLVAQVPLRVELQESVLPLPVAARTVYASVYQQDDLSPADASLLAERLDGVASAIACIADLYAREDATSGAYRQVSQHEVHIGLFRRGGDQLCFKDGPPITDLFVTRSGLDHVLSLLHPRTNTG